MNKPLLWSLRVLAVALFAGVLVWQVVRRQREANAEAAAEAQVKADAPLMPAKNTQFLNGSKSYTGSVTANSGTLVIGEATKEKPEKSRLELINVTGKSGTLVLPEEVKSAKPYVGGSLTKSGEVMRAADVDWSVFHVGEKAAPQRIQPEWKTLRNRQAMVFGTRLIGPQNPNPVPPTFIPSSKSAVMSRYIEVTPEFLKEFGVDTDMVAPPKAPDEVKTTQEKPTEPANAPNQPNPFKQ